MGVFTPVELAWKGAVYTVKPHRVMGMISRIEDTITFEELKGHCSRGAMPMAKLCTAYASALQYAGAKVSADEVYDHAFSSEEAQEAVVMAAINLMKMMMPPAARARLDAALAAGDDDAAPDGDIDPGNPPATAPAS